MKLPFIGHEDSWNYLCTEAREARLPGVYLFHGQQGIGKSIVANYFAAYLICEQIEKPCLNCDACKRVISDHHPDCKIVRPLEKRKTISVDQCREVIAEVSLAPLEAPYKIIIFPDTGLLKSGGWNALLKTLEEPLPNRLFILVATDLSGVLPTIRSRCRKIAFKAPPIQQSLAFLKERNPQVPVEDVEESLIICNGSIGTAQMMLDSSMLVSVAQARTVRTYQDVQNLVEQILKTDLNLDLFFQALLKQELEYQTQQVSSSRFEWIDQIMRAHLDIRANVNKTFVLENLLCK
jgi:DNA polymerase-3 subunit delta'